VLAGIGVEGRVAAGAGCPGAPSLQPRNISAASQ